MSNGIINVSQNALVATYEVNGETVQLDPQVVRNFLVQGNGQVTDQEIVFFVNLCKAQKLNPFVRDCYLIKYGSSPAQMVVGKSAYMRRAYENPNYICKEDGIVVLNNRKEIVKKEGACVYPGETLVGAWCRVHYIRHGAERKAYREVALAEYNKGQSSWKQMPATMLQKTAIAQALREAFPVEYAGLYEETEMITSGAVPALPDKKAQPPVKREPEASSDVPPVQPEPAAPVQSSEQTTYDDPVVPHKELLEMFNLAHATFGKDDGNQVIRNLLEEVGMTSTKGMRRSVYEHIMESLEEACDLRRSISELEESGETGDDAEQESIPA